MASQEKDDCRSAHPQECGNTKDEAAETRESALAIRPPTNDQEDRNAKREFKRSPSEDDA